MGKTRRLRNYLVKRKASRKVYKKQKSRRGRKSKRNMRKVGRKQLRRSRSSRGGDDDDEEASGATPTPRQGEAFLTELREQKKILEQRIRKRERADEDVGHEDVDRQKLAWINQTLEDIRWAIQGWRGGSAASFR